MFLSVFSTRGTRVQESTREPVLKVFSYGPMGGDYDHGDSGMLRSTSLMQQKPLSELYIVNFSLSSKSLVWEFFFPSSPCDELFFLDSLKIPRLFPPSLFPVPDFPHAKHV